LNETISLLELTSSRYRELVCYPKFTEEGLKQRIKELKGLNVEALKITGKKQLLDFRVLGKGHSGVVVVAIIRGGKQCALKIRRPDSGKPNIIHETLMLTKANSVGVGPKLVGNTANFLLMELIEGTLIDEWICSLKGLGRGKRLKRVLKAVLEECRSLDNLGLDHGELSRATKHIMVRTGDHPFIIDFDKSSLGRRVTNVTSVCQYLFIGGHIASKVKRMLKCVDNRLLIEDLKRYKSEKTDQCFSTLLSDLNLL
jgi:putative serine/threonine protein kinase